MKTLLAACASLVASTVPSIVLAQTTYKQPPDAIRRVLDTPPTPSVSMSPSNDTLVLMNRLNLPPVADLAAPMLRLAGLRLNPSTNGPHGPRRISGLTLRNVADGAERTIQLPENANLSAPAWTVDGRKFLFTNTLESTIELWVCDVASGKATKVADGLNAAGGGTARWLPDQKRILVKLVPSGRGLMPTPPRTPAGPVVQDATGTTAPVRTYQDLLQNSHDEEVFDWIMTAQLAVIDPDTGKTSPIGTPAIYADATPSPDGKFILSARTVRPYSYQVPMGLFPEVVEVLDASSGKVVKEIAKVPLRDNIPTQGVETGPRGFEWIETRPAMLLWAEALDGGDPRAKVPHRDRVMTLGSPFSAAATEATKVQHRFSGVSWLEEQGSQDHSQGLLSEFERERRWSRTWLVRLDASGTAQSDPRLLFDRSVNDRYNDPGSPISERTKQGFTVIKVTGAGTPGASLLLRGEGASKEGDRPFLDQLTLADFSKKRLWQNSGDEYEAVIDVADSTGSALITAREDKLTPSNLYWRELKTDAAANADTAGRRALTQFKDPNPELRAIKKEIITYTRDDGVPLSATMYTPPNYTPGTRLPLVIWAYPNEVSDASTAGQVAGSENRFTQFGGSSHLFLLLAGYAVMDDASMPIVGDPETVNDTFVRQIVSSAKAAIDKADEMGIGDPARVAVAGHSYGAFMTANLLAHAPAGMFKAGCARSGAYNRTLTPFGFQSERRSFWEAQDVYMKLSPFTYADKIKTPLLMIHGQIDNNPGTFPMQSERLFQAVKGQGGTARLVMLPFESHGYAARESVMHVHAETIEWFDTYVKNAK